MQLSLELTFRSSKLAHSNASERNSVTLAKQKGMTMMQPQIQRAPAVDWIPTVANNRLTAWATPLAIEQTSVTRWARG